MIDKYTTLLTKSEEDRFDRYFKNLSPNLKNDTDYDIRGAFLNNEKEASNGHLPDTFKKPNHPTFSNQSIYHNPSEGLVGGKWERKNNVDMFTPSPLNVANSDLDKYFKRVEPNVKLNVAPLRGIEK